MSTRARLSGFRSSFQFKLFFVFTLLTAFISILFCTLYITTEINENRSHAREQLHLLARHLADSVRLPLYAENTETLKQLAGDAVRIPEIRAVVITASDGRVLADAHTPDPDATTNLFSETVEVRSNNLASSPETAIVGGRDSDGALIGTVRLERGSGDLSRKNHIIVVVSICIAVCFWLAVSFLCHLVLRQVTRSFNALVRGVEMMQAGDYSSRIAVTSNDEPGRAALAINELANALQQRDEENSRLNAELLNAMQVEVQSKEKLAAVNRALETEIAERVHAEQAAREGEQNIRSLMDVMPVGVAWTDLAGTIEYLNNFFVERFGYSREEIRTADDWFFRAYPDPCYREQIAETRRAAHAEAEEAELSGFLMYEARATCKDGTVRHILHKIQTSANRKIIIIIDITEREMFREQLIKTQRLESLGVLAGGIAHNFNNALTGVLGYISIARKFLDNSHNAFMLLEKAEKAAQRAAGMANQLLTFARGGAPIKKAVSVRQLVDESVSMSLTGTSVRCHVEMPATLHAVKADEGQLNQVFNNIIINAAQAMPAGGMLTISAENITMAGGNPVCPQQVEYVRLSFADEGRGIPEENLKKIFDPYFSTKDTGTGLGLASAHSIVYKHGGQISVTSEVGKGTTFTICLPSAGALLPMSDAGSGQLTSGVPMSGTVLVMDDEEMIRSFAVETLGFLGYQAASCANGDEAVALYKSARESGAPFMAVILDLTIPYGMGGAEAAQHILAFDPAAKLIVSSGYSSDQIMAGYRNYGFCAALTKPYKADELGRELSFLISPCS